MAHNHSGEFWGEDCCCHLRVQVLRLWGAYVGSGVISVAETSCVGDVVSVAETSCVGDVVRRRRRRTSSTQKCCVDSAPSRSSVTARRHGDRDGAPSRSIVRRAVSFERACACTHARQCRCSASSAAQMRLGIYFMGNIRQNIDALILDEDVTEPVSMKMKSLARLGYDDDVVAACVLTTETSLTTVMVEQFHASGAQIMHRHPQLEHDALTCRMTVHHSRTLFYSAPFDKQEAKLLSLALSA